MAVNGCLPLNFGVERIRPRLRILICEGEEVQNLYGKTDP